MIDPRPERLRSAQEPSSTCLLYTSDAADERSSVDLGGRRIIKKKTDDRSRRGRMINNTHTKHTYISTLTLKLAKISR